MADYTAMSNPGKSRPKMTKLYDGRNVATRPIPVFLDASDLLAIRVAAANFVPKTFAVKMASGPRPTGADVVFGTVVAGGANPPMGTSGNVVGLMETI